MSQIHSLVVGCCNDDFVLRIPCDGGGYLATSDSVPVPFAQGGGTFYAPIAGAPNQLAPHSFDGVHLTAEAGYGPTAGSLFVQLIPRTEPGAIIAYDRQTGAFQRVAASAEGDASFLIDPQGAIFCWHEEQIWKTPADGNGPSVFIKDVDLPYAPIRWSPKGDLCRMASTLPSLTGALITSYDDGGNFLRRVVSVQQAFDSSPYQKDNPNEDYEDYEDFTFGPDGNIYAIDYGWNRIVRWDGLTGDYIDVFLNDVDAFAGWSALGLQFSPDGEYLYVATVNDYAGAGETPAGVPWDLLGAIQVFPAKGGPFVSFIYQGEQYARAMTFITQEFQFRPPISTFRPGAQPPPLPPPPWQADFLLRVWSGKRRPSRRPMRRDSHARAEMKKDALEFWYGLDEDAKQAITAAGILRLGRIFQDPEIAAGIREVFERKFNMAQLKRLKSLLGRDHLEDARE